ncbi:putative phage antitermination protein Q [Yersinia frederiksenii]|nr:putative phage antitermination protein Q [Yersinia frederiksenii]CNJ00375.1 putative phage antitermination protein Q [Yersinia frederiksenii]
MPNKITGGIIALLVVLFLLLLLNRNSLSNEVEKAEEALREEQSTNTALGNIIDAYQMNDAANRTATARQLENERKLRNESEDRLKRFLAASSDDKCAIQRMPDASINILRE